MIAIDGSSSSGQGQGMNGVSSPIHPALHKATTCNIITPCDINSDVESILSDAERSAQSELRSTSEILKLAGSVLRDRAGVGGGVGGGWSSPVKSPLSLSSPRPSPGGGRDRAVLAGVGSGGLSSPVEYRPSLSSPRPSPGAPSPRAVLVGAGGGETSSPGSPPPQSFTSPRPTPRRVLAGAGGETPSSIGSPPPPSSFTSPRPSPEGGAGVLRERTAAGGSASVDAGATAPLSVEIGSSPPSSPPQSPTPEDVIHLPGKFGALSSAEVKRKLSSSPVKRTELLSKLDGLDRVVPSFSGSFSGSGAVSPSADDGGSDGLAERAVRSSSAASLAMENAHAHANRIKEDNLARRHRRLSLSPSSRPNLGLSSMAVDQSVRARSARSRPFSGAMPRWVKRKAAAEKGERKVAQRSPGGYVGQYEAHSSETIVTHVLNRGDWTWTTEWSPDGGRLALATENHGLAIVEAGSSMTSSSSLVWKVVHDERVGRAKNDATHTVRSIAWGGTFIALGGTGDAVSIVDPQSYEVVDVITGTGFVGALSWHKNSNVLAIGSREDRCLIAEIRRGEEGGVMAATSNVLHSIERSDWVTAVEFSHGGTKLAIGDRSGLLSVYLFVMIRPGEPPALSPLQDVQMEDAILDVRWSPDGKFLYCGGEDYSLTVLDTAKYSVLHRVGRDRWVTFASPSRDGSYLAAGGGSSHASLLDVVGGGWEDVTSLPSGGGGTTAVPLSATWHPRDEYLAVSGQFDDVVVYESSCRRMPAGKCLRSRSSVLAVEFSPDGKTIVVGNETGLITFFDVGTDSNEAPETLYETVIGVGGEVAVKWTPDGRHVAVASGSTFVLLDASPPDTSARFLVRKVVQSGVGFASLTVSPDGRFAALADDRTRVLDLADGCSCARVLDRSDAVAWSKDGSLLAAAGGRSVLKIHDATPSSPEKWELLFSISFKTTISSLCWGPSAKEGLQYLAFGGGNETVAVLEIRTHERTWETVLHIPCDSHINDLVWSDEGLLCVGDDDGTVSVADLSYLKSGRAVSEMNYNWQRQGVISQTKLTRNLGRNAITSLCWLPSGAAGEGRDLLAVGGSDGIFEVVDLS